MKKTLEKITKRIERMKYPKLFYLTIILALCIIVWLILGWVALELDIAWSIGTGVGIFIDAIVGFFIVVGMSYATKREGLNMAFLASILIIIRRIFAILSR